MPERSPNIKAWNSLPSDEKKLYARFMELYAGYLTYTDHEVGRIVDYLKKINQLDNTLILVIIGDNGASKERALSGVIARSSAAALAAPLSQAEQLKSNLAEIDKIGTPEGTNANYPLGWAQAVNTPFKYWKQDAQSEGGTRNPLIVFYPKGIKDKGGIRNQYGHVIDLLPTTLEYVGIKAPEFIRGIKQDSIQGLRWFIHSKVLSQPLVIPSSTTIFSVRVRFIKTAGKPDLPIRRLPGQEARLGVRSACPTRPITNGNYTT